MDAPLGAPEGGAMPPMGGGMGGGMPGGPPMGLDPMGGGPMGGPPMGGAGSQPEPPPVPTYDNVWDVLDSILNQKQEPKKTDKPVAPKFNDKKDSSLLS